MEIFAWTGVAIGALLVIIYAVIWLVGMLSNPIGRYILIGWTLTAAIAWAVLGGIYLVSKAG
jgi:hypothetical protein